MSKRSRIIGNPDGTLEYYDYGQETWKPLVHDHVEGTLRVFDRDIGHFRTLETSSTGDPPSGVFVEFLIAYTEYVQGDLVDVDIGMVTEPGVYPKHTIKHLDYDVVGMLTPTSSGTVMLVQDEFIITVDKD